MQPRQGKTVTFKSPVIQPTVPVLNEDFFKTLCDNATSNAWAVNPSYFKDTAMLSEVARQNLVGRFFPKLYLFNLGLDSYKKCFHLHLINHPTTILGLDSLKDQTVMSIIEILPTKTRLTVLGVENISDKAIVKLVETLEGMTREGILIPMQYGKNISVESGKKIDEYNLNVTLQLALLKNACDSPSSPTSSAHSMTSSDSSNSLSSTAVIMSEMRVRDVAEEGVPRERLKADPVPPTSYFDMDLATDLDPLPYSYWDGLSQQPEYSFSDVTPSKNTLRF